MTEDEISLKQAHLASSTWSPSQERRSFRTVFNLNVLLSLLKTLSHENGACSYKQESRLAILSLISLIY